jgi:hypothetical protein
MRKSGSAANVCENEAFAFDLPQWIQFLRVASRRIAMAV